MSRGKFLDDDRRKFWIGSKAYNKVHSRPSYQLISTSLGSDIHYRWLCACADVTCDEVGTSRRYISLLYRVPDIRVRMLRQCVSLAIDSLSFCRLRLGQYTYISSKLGERTYRNVDRIFQASLYPSYHLSLSPSFLPSSAFLSMSSRETGRK